MTQEQYDQKKKDIHKQFGAERRKNFLIFLVYNIAVYVALYFLCDLLTLPFAITIGFASTFVSCWIWVKNIAELSKSEEQQYILLQQEQPMKRFKYDE